MVAGIIGVPLGSILSQKMAKRFPTADPLICAFGLIFSVPLLTGAMIIVTQNSVPTYVLIFLGQLSLNMNWAIVADILLVRYYILLFDFYHVIVVKYVIYIILLVFFIGKRSNFYCYN